MLVAISWEVVLTGGAYLTDSDFRGRNFHTWADRSAGEMVSEDEARGFRHDRTAERRYLSARSMLFGSLKSWKHRFKNEC